MEGEFSVCQFFKGDGGYEFVRRFVDPEEAVKVFKHYTTSVGAKIGITVRVIITDGGDFTTMEWRYGEGLVYPLQLVETWNRLVYGNKGGIKK